MTIKGASPTRKNIMGAHQHAEPDNYNHSSNPLPEAGQQRATVEANLPALGGKSACRALRLQQLHKSAAGSEARQRVTDDGDQPASRSGAFKQVLLAEPYEYNHSIEPLVMACRCMAPGMRWIIAHV